MKAFITALVTLAATVSFAGGKGHGKMAKKTETTTKEETAANGEVKKETTTKEKTKGEHTTETKEAAPAGH